MGDALLKLKDGNRASLYIPDINWNEAKAELNSNSLHLLTRTVTADQTEEADQSTLQDHFTWTVRLMDLQHLLHLPMPPRIRILRRFSSPEPLRRSVCR